jgi:cell fate regulator YaaT (PSP1 superfamily)
LSFCPLTVGDYVIVEGDRGEDMGKVLSMSAGICRGATSKVLRHANAQEINSFQHMAQYEQERVAVANAISKEGNLGITVHRVALQHDQKKMIVYYTAEDHTDFRFFVHMVYMRYRCRVWMERLRSEPTNTEGRLNSGNHFQEGA